MNTRNKIYRNWQEIIYDNSDSYDELYNRLSDLYHFENARVIYGDRYSAAEYMDEYYPTLESTCYAKAQALCEYGVEDPSSNFTDDYGNKIYRADGDYYVYLEEQANEHWEWENANNVSSGRIKIKKGK